MATRSAVFWVGVAITGLCAVCSMGALAMVGLGVLTAEPTALIGGTRATNIPTGETPDLFPGTPGWLPSGRGVPIPDAEFVDGRPVGLWWFWQGHESSLTCDTVLYLADGTRAVHPRPGGPKLFDLEGQRAQRGHTGVGTFTVEGATITQHADGFTSRGELSSGEDDEGPWFAIDSQRLGPIRPIPNLGLVGTWATPGARYSFHDDGTFEQGVVSVSGDWTLAAGGKGTWRLDGYLLQLEPVGAPSWITTVGASGDRFVVLGNRLYTRQ